MTRLKNILMWIILSNLLFGATTTFQYWGENKTFTDYLISRNVPLNILNNVPKTDLEFLSDIEANQLFYELRDSKGILEQTLIPIGEEMQIRLAKEKRKNVYTFDIIPIKYKEEEYSATVTIKTNLYSDITNTLHHSGLADKMGQLFKGTLNAKKFQKGDKVSFLYTQKTRMGFPSDTPRIKIALYESKGKKQFIYADEDGYGYKSAKTSQAYTVKGRKKITYKRRVNVKGTSNFEMPLRHVRITSSFTHKRFHPILKRYRPHHGTDFGAKKGTPLLAVNSGKIIFAQRWGSYGNVVKIKHKGGYESLYAHQSRIKAKKGQYVKKGQIIGYVGSTGRSTGPHLHFGLKKNGKWIDPMKTLNKKNSIKTVLKTFTKYKTTTKTKYKEVTIKDAKKNEKKLLNAIKKGNKPFVWDEHKTSMTVVTK